MFSSAFDIWTQTPSPPHPSPLHTPQTSPFHHLFSNVNTNTITPSFVRDTADTLIVCKRVRMGFFVGGGLGGVGDGVERWGLEVDGGGWEVDKGRGEGVLNGGRGVVFKALRACQCSEISI